MSNRQKSFFDQDQKPKVSLHWKCLGKYFCVRFNFFQAYKGPWKGTRNGAGQPHSNRIEAFPQRQVTTGPPIMPSAQTRTKLKAFAFIEGAPTLESLRKREAEKAEKENLPVHEGAPATESLRRREAEKENLPVPFKAKETPKASKVVDNVGQKPAETPKLGQSKSFPPPSTPAARLPLADLVANAEDSRTRNPPNTNVSPDEQLCWRGSQPVNTPMPRKRKRSKSSSPAPSQDEQRYEIVIKETNTPLAVCAVQGCLLSRQPLL